MECRAAVDVGTNSIRLLVVPERDLTRRLQTLRAVVRLGAGLEEGNRIREPEWRCAVEVLADYRAEMDRMGVGAYRAAGTAVLRRAVNAPAFIRHVREQTGLAIEILDEEEEARLSVRGVLEFVAVPTEYAVVFDIGGGSTECALCRGKEILAVRSVPLGAVTLTRRYLEDRDPPLPEAVYKARKEARDRVEEAVDAVGVRAVPPEAYTVVGSAGTVATLASILQGMRRYDPDRVNGFILPKDRLDGLFRKMISMASEVRAEIPGLEPGRADIIPAGMLIVLGLLEVLKKDSLVAADAGLLEGLIFSMG